jgi:MFS transporter, DHA2 family, multidrug resistance protein
MIAMSLVARLLGRVDPRLLMVTGLVVLGISMYDMSRINLYVDNATVMRIGFVQGFGLSLITAPLAPLVFSTLAEELRVEGAAMYNLMRNIAGSVGVSVLFGNVAAQTQMVHSRLAENITAFEGVAPLPPPWQWSSTAGAMTLDAEIIRQAASVAYLDAYFMMAVLVVLTIPMCFLFSSSGRVTVESTARAAAEH